MKVLLYDTTNAFLTPGGKTTHALKLQQEISKLNVDIQFSRWWDISQRDADIIHFLTADPTAARFAKLNGKKTLYSMIFDFESNKSNTEKLKTKLKIRIKDMLSISGNAYWKSLSYMDLVHFMHEYDRLTAMDYFPDIFSNKDTIIIPHAYDDKDMYISDGYDINEMHLPSKYLVSVANISERKNTLLLAKLAKEANVPIVFLGSRSEHDPYYCHFKEEVDNVYVIYPGYVSKEWKDCILRNASGYVLLSKGESGCIAVYEAAAYKIPLLLSNLPWAWGYDSPIDISLCDISNMDVARNQLRTFYNNANRLNHTPFKVYTWSEIAEIYVEQYEKLLLNDLK